MMRAGGCYFSFSELKMWLAVEQNKESQVNDIDLHAFSENQITLFVKYDMTPKKHSSTKYEIYQS